jgi:hypothetical protein
MTLLVVFAVWFAAAIPVAIAVGPVIARCDRDTPPPPRPAPIPEGETHDRLRQS